jgi:hypothetical protein
MSRAVVYQTFVGPEVLELRDVPEPHAGPGEVRVRVTAVRVTAVRLNPMDWIISSTPEAAAMFGGTVPSGTPGFACFQRRKRNGGAREPFRARGRHIGWGRCLRASGVQEP